MHMIYQIRDLRNNHPYLLPPGTLLVGRNDDANIIIDDESISRTHAKIHNSDGGIWIEDLDSTNGTLVRGNLIESRTQIEPGETFQIGLVDFLLDPETHDEKDAPPPAPPPKIAWDKFQRKTHRLPRKERMGHITDAPPHAHSTASAPSVSPYDPAPQTPMPNHTVPAAFVEPSVNYPAVKNPPNVPWQLMLTLAAGTGMALGLILGLVFARFWFRS